MVTRKKRNIAKIITTTYADEPSIETPIEIKFILYNCSYEEQCKLNTKLKEYFLSQNIKVNLHSAEGEEDYCLILGELFLTNKYFFLKKVWKIINSNYIGFDNLNIEYQNVDINSSDMSSFFPIRIVNFFKRELRFLRFYVIYKRVLSRLICSGLKIQIDCINRNDEENFKNIMKIVYIHFRDIHPAYLNNKLR